MESFQEEHTASKMANTVILAKEKGMICSFCASLLFEKGKPVSREGPAEISLDTLSEIEARAFCGCCCLVAVAYCACIDARRLPDGTLPAYDIARQEEELVVSLEFDMIHCFHLGKLYYLRFIEDQATIDANLYNTCQLIDSSVDVSVSVRRRGVSRILTLIRDSLHVKGSRFITTPP
jgi:hypothetical protein